MILKPPTEAVADNPVKDTVVKVDIVTLPTEDVAEIPVTVVLQFL